MEVNPTLEKVGGNGIQSTSILDKKKDSSLLRWRKNREIYNREFKITKLKKFLPNSLFFSIK